MRRKKKRRCERCFGCCTSLYEVDKKWEDGLLGVEWTQINVGKIAPRQRKDRFVSLCPMLVIASRLSSRCIIYALRPVICQKYTCWWLHGREKVLNRFPPQ